MIRILVFGSFDPFHKGHLYYLKQAKKLGDILIVVVSSDEKIRKIKKHKPREGEQQRLRKIEDLKIADKVMIGEPAGDYNIIEKLNPDIIALGYDQKIPEPLKNKLNKYKIVRLKPYKPEIYKSSKLAPSSSG